MYLQIFRSRSDHFQSFKWIGLKPSWGKCVHKINPPQCAATKKPYTMTPHFFLQKGGRQSTQENWGTDTIRSTPSPNIKGKDKQTQKAASKRTGGKQSRRRPPPTPAHPPRHPTPQKKWKSWYQNPNEHTTYIIIKRKNITKWNTTQQLTKAPQWQHK